MRLKRLIKRASGIREKNISGVISFKKWHQIRNGWDRDFLWYIAELGAFGANLTQQNRNLCSLI